MPRLEAVAYGAGKYVAVGYTSFVDFDPIILASVDGGVSWTNVSFPQFAGNSFDFVSGYLNAIHWNGQKFIAVGKRSPLTGDDSRIILSSADGTTWELVEDDAEVPTELYSVTYGNNTWVAGGQYGGIVTSPTGASGTWINRGELFYGGVYGLCFGAGKFVAGTDEGEIAYSANGSSWTKIGSNPFSSFDGSLYGVYLCYGDELGRFVAIGYTNSDDNPNRIAYSNVQD